MKKRLIVAIDGPSGAGKSTLSKALAKELGYINLDTGAMYRSVALQASTAGIDVTDQDSLGVLARAMTISFVKLVGQQRLMGAQGGVVLEGRDIGTVVFPQAEAKFFLSASAAERGRRRYEELKAKGENVDLDRTIAEVEARDAADTAREHSPLVQAEDALAIDTTSMSIDEVLDTMLKTIRSLEEE